LALTKGKRLHMHVGLGIQTWKWFEAICSKWLFVPPLNGYQKYPWILPEHHLSLLIQPLKVSLRVLPCLKTWSLVLTSVRTGWWGLTLYIYIHWNPGEVKPHYPGQVLRLLLQTGFNAQGCTFHGQDSRIIIVVVRVSICSSSEDVPKKKER